MHEWSHHYAPLLALFLIIFSLPACTHTKERRKAMDVSEQNSIPREVKPTRLTAVLKPVGPSSKVRGAVHFEETADARVRVSGKIMGLQPNSRHGLHIHEFGRCDNRDGMSAGAHYNPESLIHGSLTSEKRHAGDFGNIEADSNGVAVIHLVANNISLMDGKNPVVGRSLVIHAGEDDLTSQPAGNAGARVACGVIGVTGQASP